MGDFNMAEIKLNSMYAQASSESLVSLPSRFFDLTQDLFLHQHSQENTRFRIDQESSQLDLLFANDQLMISDVRYKHPIGKSDHVVLVHVFTFHGGEVSDRSQDNSAANLLWH